MAVGLSPLPASAGGCDQVTGEISAIDGRHILWLQHRHGLCVVPVEEMAAIARELAQRPQCLLEPFGGIALRYPAEVIGTDGGQQIEPDVGRRRAIGNDGLGHFLKVIRRQIMIIRGDEVFEEPPRPARRQPKALFIAGCKLLARAARWRETHPPGNGGRNEPKRDHRQSDA